jgi:NADPH:quinone reductase
MSTMKAIQISKPGGIEALEYNDVTLPSPAEGQVLVKNAYTGVNFIDT